MERSTPPTHGERRPTISDVARLAGVSRSAVSKVYNGRPGISATTEAKIRDAARQLRWAPSATAIALRGARAATVGLVLSRSAGVGGSGVPATLVAGMDGVMAEHGLGLLVRITESEEQERQVYRHLAEGRRVDGVLLTDSRVGDRRFDLMRELSLPAVLVGTPWREDPIAHLGHGSHGAAMPQIAEHLLSIGHRRIAMISGPTDQVEARFRADSLSSALADAGVPLRRELTGPYTGSSAAERTTALLQDVPDVTAIVYGTDEMAIAGMHSAREAGRVVPRDLSVVGYNGSDLGSWVNPPLTTVRRDLLQRGRAASALLLELIGVPLVSAADYPVDEPSLIVRASTAKPPG